MPALFRYSLENTEVLLLGDTNHDDVELKKAIFDKKNLLVFLESGASKLLIEIDPKYNGKLQQYFRGDLDYQSIHDSLVYGISCQSTSAESGLNQPIFEAFKLLNNAGVLVAGIDPQSESSRKKLIQVFAAANVIPYDTHKQIEASQLLLERADMDHLLARNIDASVKNGQKVIVYYGSAHGSRPNDGIPEKIPEKLLKIDIYSNRKHYKDLSADLEKSPLVGDPPELVYLQDTGTVYFTAKTPE
jgi:hypothetical protein